jgi:molecular chaperone DnaK
MNITISRSKLEQLVDELIQRSIEPCKTAMKDAGVTGADIDEVILVGGMTRMPKVQEVVEKLFGKAPRRDVNPDEAVAAGAAVQGSVLAGDRTDVLLLDVTPLSLGIETMGGIMAKLIQKNTTIPTKASQTFSTADDNQPAVTIKCFQGERELVQHNKLLGEFNLEGIAPAMRGTPQIEVTLDIDANGIMHVSAKDKNTGKENKITIKSDSGLSKEEIERMVQEAEANAEEDKKQRELIETRNMADAQIHSIRKDMKDVEGSLSQEEKDKIETAIKELDDAVASGDKETVTQKLSDLLAATEPIRKAKEQKDKDKAEGVMDAEVTEVV